jgi:predicted dehydrogenase
MHMNRRSFVGAALTAASATRILGANDSIRVGLIGCGARGRYISELAMKVPGVRFAAVCDVFQENSGKAANSFGGVPAHEDFRRVLDTTGIDAVIVATPEHWHATQAVLACQAGKDVYVEKPMCHNVWEGRKMVEAARRYNRVVQTGTQHRSAPHFAELAQRVRAGEFGRILSVRCFHYRNRFPDGIGNTPDQLPPKGMNWDFFCGPAPLVPYSENRQKYWLQYYEFSGGSVTDMAIHYFDTVHEIMGQERPVSVAANGNRFFVKDDGNVPDVLQIVYEYPGFLLTWDENRINSYGIGARTPGMKYHQTKGDNDHPTGMIFYGTHATVVADRVGYEIFPDAKIPSNIHEPKQAVAEDVTTLHVANFFDCVRSRKRPNADVEIGHRATLVGHIGNIAYRTGRKLNWDADKEDFRGPVDDARSLLTRAYRKPWGLIS